MPKKPVKPVYLCEYTEVQSVLGNASDSFVNPVCTDCIWFSKKIADILVPGQIGRKSKSAIDIDPRMVLGYFAAVTREILKEKSSQSTRSNDIPDRCC